jgi:hypothetical protein
MKTRWFRFAWHWSIRTTALITAPLWVPIVVVALVTEVAFLPREWQVRRRMRCAGRWLPRAELLERLQAGCGTLIVEWPTPGWQFCRAWWTPEVIEQSNQELSEIRRLRQLECCYHERYTDLKRGTALLVSVWWGEWLVRKLERRFPGVRVVRYCSFFPDLAESELVQN